MLNRLRLRRGAGPAEPVAPEPDGPVGNAWDILGGSAIRHPDAFAAAVPVPAPDRPAPAEADPAPVIHALFQATLGRDPRDEEVGFYARLRDEHGHPGWVGASVRVLTDSPEFVARMRGPVEAAMLGAAADGDAPPIRHAVGLGTHCYAGWLLRDMGLRRSTSPFDWLFSSPELITHCLEDDFATLVDRAHHERYSPHRQALHRFYHEGFGTDSGPMAAPPLFWHHDPTTDEDHARLVRGVERFRRLLDSPDEKLFLMVVARNRRQDGLAGAVEAMAAALDARTRNATVLAVTHAAVGGEVDAHSARVWGQGRHSLHALHSSSEMVEGLSFAHQFDNLLIKRLIYRHRFEVQPAP